MKTLAINKHIYQTLINSELKEIIGEKIFPIATKTEVQFPFIVYERSALEPSYDKGGMSTAESTINIYVLSETYTQSLELAEMVIAALDRVYVNYDDFSVIGATLTGAFESYTNQTYIQQLTFNFITR